MAALDSLSLVMRWRGNWFMHHLLVLTMIVSFLPLVTLGLLVVRNWSVYSATLSWLVHLVHVLSHELWRSWLYWLVHIHLLSSLSWMLRQWLRRSHTRPNLLLLRVMRMLVHYIIHLFRHIRLLTQNWYWLLPSHHVLIWLDLHGIFRWMVSHLLRHIMMILVDHFYRLCRNILLMNILGSRTSPKIALILINQIFWLLSLLRKFKLIHILLIELLLLSQES
jgi:hypothetical protein